MPQGLETWPTEMLRLKVSAEVNYKLVTFLLKYFYSSSIFGSFHFAGFVYIVPNSVEFCTALISSGQIWLVAIVARYKLNESVEGSYYRELFGLILIRQVELKDFGTCVNLRIFKMPCFTPMTCRYAE